MYQQPFISDLVRRLAPKLGAAFYIEPEFGHFGYIDFPNGRRTFFRDNRFDLNTLAAVRVVQDKAICSHMLRRFGYSVPEEITFWQRRKFLKAPEKRNVEQAIEFAERIGWPVFVKPNDRSQGKAVSQVWNRRELRVAARRVFRASDVAIVQQACVGRDYRLVVLDGKVIQCYERVPLTVTGDGKSTIQQLLDSSQLDFIKVGRDTTIRVSEAMRRHLHRAGLSLRSVPEKDRQVRLTEVANLSLGGSSVEATKLVHPSFKKLSKRIAQDLNLRFCGIDLITADIRRASPKYIILEVNGSPGLDHYALADEAAQAAWVDSLYLKVLKAASRVIELK
ncbi:MAG TPA: hypothetical protein PK402_06565 [Tepidisphaeraceae bacterium]|nr:hypothetical protein [Tepidisphaeraceae bacterium]